VGKIITDGEMPDDLDWGNVAEEIESCGSRSSSLAARASVSMSARGAAIIHPQLAFAVERGRGAPGTMPEFAHYSKS
jgi:hypothetical protein